VARDPHTYYDVVVVVALQARHRPVHCYNAAAAAYLVFPRPGIPESDAAAGSAGTGIGRCHRAPLVWAALAQASLYRSAVQLKQTHQPDYRYHIIGYSQSQAQQAAKVRLSPCMGRAQESRRGKLPYALRAWKTKESILERSRRQNDGAT
jgi:hypothetical protein